MILKSSKKRSSQNDTLIKGYTGINKIRGLDGNFYPTIGYYNNHPKSERINLNRDQFSGNITKEQVEKIASIMEKGEYLSLGFELLEKVNIVENALRKGTLTIQTANGTIKVLTTLQAYKALTKSLGFVGTLGTGVDIGVNIYEYNTGEISGTRLAYRLTGNVASIATPIIYGAIVGSNGGPLGTVLGITIGVSFYAGEITYDEVRRQYKGLTNFLGRVKQGW